MSWICIHAPVSLLVVLVCKISAIEETPPPSNLHFFFSTGVSWFFCIVSLPASVCRNRAVFLLATLKFDNVSPWIAYGNLLCKFYDLPALLQGQPSPLQPAIFPTTKSSNFLAI